MFTKKAGDPEHNHRIEVDGDGTGETIDTSCGVPHTHKLTNWSVEEVSGHTHAISSDLIRGSRAYGNGDESVVIIGEGETIEEKIQQIEVEVSIKYGGLGADVSESTEVYGKDHGRKSVAKGKAD